MRARHHKMDGGSCEHRARGGAVSHHPDNSVKRGEAHHPDNAMKHVGEGDRAKVHAARRARGGTCWFCGDSFDKGKKSGGGIHIKKSHEGLLHKNLHVPAGQHIPAGKLAKAKHSSSPAVRKRAVFAANAKHWHHG